MSTTSVLAENGKIRLEMEISGGIVTIRPVGVIDEDTNFSVILSFITELGASMQLLQFDLGHVSRMNSCGVREWLLLMERLGSQTAYRFVNVSELIVEQANMIPNMFGRKGTQVLSFQAPYHCGNCDNDVAVLIEPKQIIYEGARPVPPKLTCRKCAGTLEFGWLEEEYFAFLKRI